MNREILTSLTSEVFLCIAIILFPHQYLFSKTVPNSVWTQYFPLPFGAGWFLTFLVLVPVIWFSTSVFKSARGGIITLLVSVILAVPVSMIMSERTLTLNSLLNQYIWVGVICLPPYLLHLSLRWFASALDIQWLTNRSKTTL